MDSNNNKKYSNEQIQFLQELVKEQRDLDQQIKVLNRACRERKSRKTQVDTTIIKYFKTNDISHINLQSSNCRLECVTVKSKSGLSQRFVTDMLDELLTDEDLARDVLDYILSGRKVTHKHKLKTVENYQQKRKRKKTEPKPEVKYTDNDRDKLVLKLKDKFNGKRIAKVKPEEINLNVENEAINEEKLTSNILKDQLAKIKEEAEKINNESIQIEPINKPNNSKIDNNSKIEIDGPTIEIKKANSKIEIDGPTIEIKKANTTYKTNNKPKKKTMVLKKSIKDEKDDGLNKSIQNILDTSNLNDIIKEKPVNISFGKPPKVNTIESQIDNFIKTQIGNLASPNSVTDLSSLYQDLMKRTDIGIDRVNQIIN
jgi:hypothetical protein